MDGDFDETVEKLIKGEERFEDRKLRWIHQLDFATSGSFFFSFPFVCWLVDLLEFHETVFFIF